MEPSAAARPRVLGLFLITVLVAVIAALALRFWLVEPEAMGAACMAGEQPWWCYPRLALVLGMIYGWWGSLAIALIVASLFPAVGRPLPWLLSGTALGSAALVIYSAGTGSLAVLLGLLRALALARRPGASA